jgi:malate/lactate dehydrogenase
MIIQEQQTKCSSDSSNPRKPGMTREELIGINVTQNVFSPEAIIVVVSNHGYYDVLGSKICWITKKQNHRNGWSFR